MVKTPPSQRRPVAEWKMCLFYVQISIEIFFNENFK